MRKEPLIRLNKPTDSKQLLHLIDMDHYFGNDLHMEPIEKVAGMNYAYGIANTKDFNEFCDTMHTALYWMNEKYSHLCQIDKLSEAINISTEIEKGEEVDDEALRYDILFGAWLSFVTYDNLKFRHDFLGELSGFTEDDFISELHSFCNDPATINLFTMDWIKKIIDPYRAAAYGHYMVYMMSRVISIMTERGENTDIMQNALTSLYILTQSVSKLCSLNDHNLSQN